MIDVKKIATEAEVIICGFAFLTEDNFIKVINLNNGHGVAVFKKDGTLIETNIIRENKNLFSKILFLLKLSF
jgi:hypothetical protein